LGIIIGKVAELLQLGLPPPFEHIGTQAALGLLLLVIAVTPANIYMYTHGAKLPMDSPPVPIAFHVVRGILQCFLLSYFYALAFPALQS